MRSSSLALGLLALGLVPVIAAADDYSPASAPREFATVKDLVLHDAKRDKDLHLRILCPAGDGPFPVIVWSHGAYGSKDAYQPLMSWWAGHGYVTIQPTHEDSVALGNRLGDPKVFQTWQSRPPDISFILDSLAEIETREPSLKGKLDGQRIGLGGHSFGANTAQLVGGARAYPGGREKSFADARVRAVMMLSGQGPGEMLRENSWADFKKPLFVMTGSSDGPTRTGQPAEWRRKPYELSPPGDKYLVWVEGLDHGYGGITGVSFNPKNKPNPDHVLWTKLATLAFWDSYLRDNPQARKYLDAASLREMSKGALLIEHK